MSSTWNEDETLEKKEKDWKLFKTLKTMKNYETDFGWELVRWSWWP